MITRICLGLLTGGLSLLAAGVAQAHVCMEVPVSRVGPSCSFGSPQKQGPCGVKGRTKNITTYRPGETITVRLNETINHPSHYRIAFNPNGDTFEDPTTVDDKDGKHPFVLLDNIPDGNAAQQSVQVTLPNVTCDNCTLQLIQVMYDKGRNGFAGNDGVGMRGDDLYYSCADIVLKGEPVGSKPSAEAGDGGVAPPTTDPVPPGVADATGPLAALAAGDGAGGSVEEAALPPDTAGGCALGAHSERTAAGWVLLGMVGLIVRGRRRRT